MTLEVTVSYKAAKRTLYWANLISRIYNAEAQLDITVLSPHTFFVFPQAGSLEKICLKDFRWD